MHRVRPVDSFPLLLAPQAVPPQAAGRYSSFLASSAQMMRAFLFATATMARFVPRRSRSSFTHRLNRSDLPAAVRTTARAPWTSRVRRCWSPRLLIPIRIVRSPLECWRGTSPSQAAMWRPLSQSCPSPTAAMTAVAVLGPTPRIRPTRWQASFARKTRSIRRSNACTRLSISVINSRRDDRISQQRSVSSFSRSSIISGIMRRARVIDWPKAMPRSRSILRI
jgi:hypothetical protein